MTNDINHDRRRFLGTALGTLVAAELGMIRSVSAQQDSSFGQLRQIDAGDLSVQYVEAGPAGGPPVVLLHGWPFDIYSFVVVVPLLAAPGYRVIAPVLRGFGGVRSPFGPTPRNGVLSVR